jgi:starch-binding outer membrane protein, SusD/RagB family
MVARRRTPHRRGRLDSRLHSSHRSQALGRLLLVLLLAGSAPACDVDRLLNAKDKDTSPVGAINSASGLPNAYAGAISQFQVGWAGSAADAGDGNEGQVNMTALLTDEYIDLETFPTRIAVDQRITAPGNGTLRGDYLDLSQARVSAERAVALYQQFDPTNVLHAEMLNLAGYSYLVFAEDFCSGIPFDSIAPSGKVIYGQPLTTDSMYARAMKDFQAALVIAAADSAANGDAKGIEQLSVSRIGQARVLLDEGQFPQAASIAALVPLSFVYAMEGSSNSPREYNGVWYFTTQLAFSVSNLEGGNGMDFASANDPRVPSLDVGTPGFSGVGQDFISEEIYTGPTSNTPLATGLEAALIVAESELQAGQTTAWAQSLNALRSASSSLLASGASIDSLPTDSTAGASSTMQVSVMFRERAFWLYLTGHRLSDMRRLIRQYHRTANEVFPTGLDAVTGSPYGNSIEFPVSSDESNNPNSHGCLNNDA